MCTSDFLQHRLVHLQLLAESDEVAFPGSLMAFSKQMHEPRAKAVSLLNSALGFTVDGRCSVALRKVSYQNSCSNFQVNRVMQGFVHPKYSALPGQQRTNEATETRDQNSPKPSEGCPKTDIGVVPRISRLLCWYP